MLIQILVTVKFHGADALKRHRAVLLETLLESAMEMVSWLSGAKGRVVHKGSESYSWVHFLELTWKLLNEKVEPTGA